MKIRSGFVTNSSSTSYTVVIEKDYFDEVLKKVHPYVTAMFKALTKGQKAQTFLGKKVITLSWMSGNSDTFEYLDIDYKDPCPNLAEGEERPDADEWDDGEPNAYQGVDKFIEALTDKDRFIVSNSEC